VAGIARAAADLAQRARAGKLRVEDVAGGTFTVNNTGALGTIQSCPIINYPQAAILTSEAIVQRPVILDGGAIAPRWMMNMCISFDHRIMDGLVVSRFFKAVRDRLEHPSRMDLY
jgi:2-oxoisovalerate dehydrogenase E2 component (dihydrolipoyl transacylase)